jgi:hypothetical protein
MQSNTLVNAIRQSTLTVRASGMTRHEIDIMPLVHTYFEAALATSIYNAFQSGIAVARQQFPENVSGLLEIMAQQNIVADYTTRREELFQLDTGLTAAQWDILMTYSPIEALPYEETVYAGAHERLVLQLALSRRPDQAALGAMLLQSYLKKAAGLLV